MWNFLKSHLNDDFFVIFKIKVMFNEKLYEQVWNELLGNGFDEGDNITYFDFVNACEEAYVDRYEINLDIFMEKYNVNIG